MMRDRFRKLITALRRSWQKRWLRRLFLWSLFFLLLFLFRFPIARGLGNFLMDEDEPVAAELIVVLGGGAYDRGAEGARIYHQYGAKEIATTGSYQPKILKVLDTLLVESDLTALRMVQLGVPEGKIVSLAEATSTFEEAEVIRRRCDSLGYQSVNIVTSKMHLRRTKWTFEKAFEDSGVDVHFCGAPSSSYDEAEWWKSEAGLIMVNNEYIKLAYYLIRY